MWDWGTSTSSTQPIRQCWYYLDFCLSTLTWSRDIGQLNVLVDLSIMSVPHPANAKMRYDYERKIRRYTRTSQPPKYYIIDFGLSRQYSPGDTCPLEDVIKSGDKNGLQNPF